MLGAVEAEMRAVVRYAGEDDRQLAGMLQYHLGWVDSHFQPVVDPAGKRIRPLFCLASCLAAGGKWEQAVPAGAALELLHNFSLIHDDIEDNSPLRRGRPALWSIWGAPQAINSGDAMFAMAHQALGRLALRDLPATLIVDAYRRFDDVCLRLTVGQQNDIRFEDEEDVSVEQYLRMIGGKTAALISLSCALGALVAGADEEVVNKYGDAGFDLGMAFQIRDDILGIWGSEEAIGKSAHSDILTRKKSLPILYGLQRSSSLRSLYASDATSPEFVAEVVSTLDELGARQYSREQEQLYSEKALSTLEELSPDQTLSMPLLSLAKSLLRRQS